MGMDFQKACDITYINIVVKIEAHGIEDAVMKCSENWLIYRKCGKLFFWTREMYNAVPRFRYKDNLIYKSGLNFGVQFPDI